MTETTEVFSWTDFQPETETTGDGSGDPDKYILTITEDGEEYAVIVHRTCGGRYPLDGELAESKRSRAQRTVELLNAVATPREPRVIEVHGYVTLSPDDEAFRLPISQIRRELPDMLGIGDLELLDIKDREV